MAEKRFDPQLQARLEKFIVEAGSQTKAAALIGYSTGTLSTYRNSKYGGGRPPARIQAAGIF